MVQVFIQMILLVSFGMSAATAQDVTTVTATGTDISDNLDLEAVATLFGDAKDLEDFERQLNDPQTQISNLDLNGDGEVDYLRVVENSESNVRLITIQAVVGKDLYQDVATIDVEKDLDGETYVQVIGDVYMYGSNYIIEPVYVYHPALLVWWWGPYYNPWISPWYWGYYPPYYIPWHPYSYSHYHQHIAIHINHNHHYNYVASRKSRTAATLQKGISRQDYAQQNPGSSFSNRNEGLINKKELTDRRIQVDKKEKQEGIKTTGKPVQGDWKPVGEKPVPKTRDDIPKTTDDKGVDLSKDKSPKTIQTQTDQPRPRTEKTETDKTKRDVPVNKPDKSPVKDPKPNLDLKKPVENKNVPKAEKKGGKDTGVKKDER